MTEATNRPETNQRREAIPAGGRAGTAPNGAPARRNTGRSSKASLKRAKVATMALSAVAFAGALVGVINASPDVMAKATAAQNPTAVAQDAAAFNTQVDAGSRPGLSIQPQAVGPVPTIVPPPADLLQNPVSRVQPAAPTQPQIQAPAQPQAPLSIAPRVRSRRS